MAIKRSLLQEDVSYVNILQYGSAFTHTTLLAAIAGIGSTRAVLILTPGAWTIGANVTVPLNIVLLITAGATVTIATGVTLTVHEYEASLPDWRTGGGTFTHNRYPDMAGRVGWKQAGAGAVNRSLAEKSGDFLSAKDFGLSTTSTNNTPAIQAAVTAALAAGKGVLIPGGQYNCATTILLTAAGLQVRGEGLVTLRHTGSGTALFVDGGASGTGIHDVVLENLTILGNTNTTYAYQFRAAHHLYCRNLHARDCDFAFGLQGCYGGVFDAPTCSSFEYAFTTKAPQIGLYLTRRNVDEPTTNCVFNGARIDGMTLGNGWGVVLEFAARNHFNGGSFRANRIGCQTNPAEDGNRYNSFQGCHFASNVVADLLVYGDSCSWRDCMFLSFGGTGCITLQSGSYMNSFHNCYAVTVNALVNSFFNSFYECFFDQSTAGIVGAGNWRVRNCGRVTSGFVFVAGITDN